MLLTVNVNNNNRNVINNSKIIRSASLKQNVGAKTAGDLKHLLDVSTVEIGWSSLLAREFVYL